MAKKNNSTQSAGEQITISPVQAKPVSECPLYYAFKYTKVDKEWVGIPMVISCEGTVKRLVHKWNQELDTNAIGPFLLTKQTKLAGNRMPEVPPYEERLRYKP